MKVSVILTSYNKARYLRQAIASVMAQTYRDWELLIVDDHSTDGSFEIAGSMLFDGIYLMKSDLPKHRDGDVGLNRYAHNINLAFTKTRGEYITYLCDDDLYLPWRLEAFAYVLDHNPVDVVYGQQQLMTEENGITRLSGARDTVGICTDAAQRIDHSSVMHRRECFEKAGGWDESAPMRYGDAYFWTRLNSAGYAFHPVPMPMDCHRYNPMSVTHKIDHPAMVGATA